VRWPRDLAVAACFVDIALALHSRNVSQCSRYATAWFDVHRFG
jgi:hypothetical protein